MALKLSSIDELDPALVASTQAELSQLLQEKYPELELSRGVIHDVVAFLAGGISGAVNQTEVNRVLQSRSLLAIQQNPELADPELVDHILSNYLTTRRTGTRARGNITIVVEGDATVVVAAGLLFAASGVNFRTDSPITARPPGAAVTLPTDRVLEPRGDGTFEFSVPATAEDVGEQANIRINTKLTPSPVPPRFVTAFASEDFIGGTATETNSQLLARMQAGLPAKVTAGRLNIEALIKDQPQFADIKNLSIVGFGDAEMTRDQHSIFPISSGGRIDIYSQSAGTPQTVVLRKTATLMEIRGTTRSIWQLAISRDDAPGFYEIDAIRRPSDPTDIAGFEVISDTRHFDLTDLDWAPDILDATEAAYTRYQTAVIRFVDNLSVTDDLTVGDTAEFQVAVSAQPLLGAIQDFLAAPDHRHLSSDVLVKGAVPCFLSINCDIVKDVTESAPNLDQIRTAIADHVNNLRFPGTLYASQLTDVIHNYLFGSQAVGAIDMHGRIRRPDGQHIVIRDPQALELPDSPSTLVTPKTTVFILYPESIGLGVVNRRR